MATGLDHGAERIGDIVIIIGHQNARGFLHAALPCLAVASGRVTRKLEPTPGSEFTEIFPKCCSTSCLAVGSPNPAPKLLVVNSGSKIFV